VTGGKSRNRLSERSIKMVRIPQNPLLFGDSLWLYDWDDQVPKYKANKKRLGKFSRLFCYNSYHNKLAANKRKRKDIKEFKEEVLYVNMGDLKL